MLKLLKLNEINEFSENLSNNKSVVSRTTSRFSASGSVNTVHSRGRPRKTSQRTVKKIIRERCVDALNRVRASQQKKPFISAKNRRARLAFAKAHINWNASR